MSSERILLIDSSTSVLRVGLADAAGKIFSAENRDRFRHAEFIISLIDRLLRENGVAKRELNGIIVSTGPGSFTGLRVGLATAKGLAQALKIPVAGVSIFEAASPRLSRTMGRAAVLIRSRREQFYSGLVDSPQFDNRMIELIDISEITARFQGIPLLPIDMPDFPSIPGLRLIEPEEFTLEHEDFLALGRERLIETGHDNLASLEPLYIQHFPAGRINE